MAEPKKQFADNLRVLEGGEFVERAADALRDLNAYLSEHARDNGKASGELTLKIKLTNEKGTVTVSSEVAVKKPKQKFAPTAVWLTPGNDFSRTAPTQMEIRPDIPRRVAEE
jgi:hypothetical protein